MSVATILAGKGNSVISLPADATLLTAAETLSSHKIGAVLVMDGEAVLGVLSERDLVRVLAKNGGAALDAPASTMMTRDVITCGPGHTIAEVMELMTEKRIRHLPVLDDGRLAGMISIGDVVKERIAETEREAATLREFIHT